MEPTSSQSYGGGYAGSTGTSSSPSYSDNSSSASTQFSTTAAHATGDNPYPTDAAQPADGSLKGKLTDAVASGKQWLTDSGLADKAQQLPQQAKDLGNKALTSVTGLTNTQKAVGVGIIAAGVAFLLTRGKKDKDDDGEYRRKPRKSPFDHQPHTKDGDYAYDRRGQRPWGASRFGGDAPQGRGRDRVKSGSGYSSEPSSHSHSNDFGRWTERGAGAGNGPRRDQGPSATSSRYDARTSGGQNPNNLDDLNSAF